MLAAALHALRGFEAHNSAFPFTTSPSQGPPCWLVKLEAVFPQVVSSNEEQRRAVEAAIAAEACFLEALVSILRLAKL